MQIKYNGFAPATDVCADDPSQLVTSCDDPHADKWCAPVHSPKELHVLRTSERGALAPATPVALACARRAGRWRRTLPRAER